MQVIAEVCWRPHWVRRLLRGCVAAACLTVVCGAAFPGTAAALSPAFGRWSGSGQGGKVYFVVSRVRGTDVFSDLVEQCANGTPSAGDIPWSRNQEGPAFRSEAAIGADGRIHDLIRVPGSRTVGVFYDAHGRLSGDHGTLTIRGGVSGSKSDGDQTCAIRNARVSRTGGSTLADGDYKVSGGEPGTDLELSVFGEGAEIWWSGLVGTPVGGVEDDPALCAEVGAVASGIGDVFDARSFASHSVSLLDAVLFAGHFSGGTHGFGSYIATSYPVCSGGGVLTWKLERRAPPLAPALPLHGGPPPPPPHHHHVRHPRPVRYVALGDSYSSGEGVRPYERGTATLHDHCHRSTRAYPLLVSLPHITFERSFYACFGATTTKNLLSEPLSGEQPQIDRPALRRAQLVTVTIGGNDAGFSAVLKQCSRPSSRVLGRCYRQPKAGRLLGKIRALRGTLVSTYDAIRARTGPHAKIVVLDYPNLFPAHGCRKLNAVYDMKTQRFLRFAGGVLDRTIRAAASEAHVRFVDVRDEFKDHELCSPHGEWIDFLVAPHRSPRAIFGSFHPNAAGQRAYARALEHALEHIL